MLIAHIKCSSIRIVWIFDNLYTLRIIISQVKYLGICFESFLYSTLFIGFHILIVGFIHDKYVVKLLKILFYDLSCSMITRHIVLGKDIPRTGICWVTHMISRCPCTVNKPLV
uniref:Uncharacterized protein n=1 Tax=Cacopsylla melanoneura TaxID=428564 RepID=A0A8D8W1U0_9HEMI